MSSSTDNNNQNVLSTFPTAHHMKSTPALSPSVSESNIPDKAGEQDSSVPSDS